MPNEPKVKIIWTCQKCGTSKAIEAEVTLDGIAERFMWGDGFQVVNYYGKQMLCDPCAEIVRKQFCAENPGIVLQA